MARCKKRYKQYLSFFLLLKLFPGLRKRHLLCAGSRLPLLLVQTSSSVLPRTLLHQPCKHRPGGNFNSIQTLRNLMKEVGLRILIRWLAMTQTHFPAQTCHSPPCRRPPTAAPTPPRRPPSSAFKVVLCCTLDAIWMSRGIIIQISPYTMMIWLNVRPRHFVLLFLEGSHHLHPALPLVPMGGGHVQG